MRTHYAIIIFLLLAVSSFAEDLPGRKGKIGGSFYFSEFDLKSFDKRMGIKYWLSNKLQLGSTVAFMNRRRSEETLSDRTEQKSTSASLSIEFNRFFLRSGHVLPYIGVFLSPRIEKTRYPSSQGNYTIKDVSFDIGLSLGVEYWVMPSLSFTGQYFLKYTYQKFTDTQFRQTYLEKTIAQFDANTFYLILSIYF